MVSLRRPAARLPGRRTHVPVLASVASRARVPTGCPQQLHARLAARADNIAPLRRAVVRVARDHGAGEREREDIALAVSEALTNTVVHAYVGHDVPGMIDVRACAAAGSLEVVVCDTGNGLRPRHGSPGPGLGVALMDRVTEQLELVDTQPGTRLRLTFAIA